MRGGKVEEVDKEKSRKMDEKKRAMLMSPSTSNHIRSIHVNDLGTQERLFGTPAKQEEKLLGYSPRETRCLVVAIVSQQRERCDLINEKGGRGDGRESNN
jgi:hypothetical protein